MPTLILMPQLPDGAEAARIVKWLVAAGDEIVAGDVIAEFDCGDEAVFLIEAADGGRVERLRVDEGARGLIEGAVIAEIADADPASPDALPAEPPPVQPQGELSDIEVPDENLGAVETAPPLPPPAAVSMSEPAAAPPDASSAVAEPRQLPSPPPVAGARLLRRGTAATIVAYLDQDELALAGADELFRSVGLDVEVIALDTLHGPGLEVVCASVSRTGRLAVVEPYVCDWPYAAEIAAEVSARAFDDLDAPPLTVRGLRSAGLWEPAESERSLAKLVAAVRRICYLS